MSISTLVGGKELKIYSRKNGGAETLGLVSPAKARKFLFLLANLGEEVEEGRHFLARFIGLWPVPGQYTQPLIDENIDRTPGAKHEDDQIIDMLIEHWLLFLRDGVRSIWMAPDLRTKQWGVYRFLEEMVVKEDESLSGTSLWPLWKGPGRVVKLPPPTPFELILRYLLRPNVHTYHCLNCECPAPYNFGRIGQKYCSEKCALPAQREFKRNWWRTKGKVWRKRAKKKPLKKGR